MADGNSYDIFFEDLDRAYRGEKPEPERYSGFAAALGAGISIAASAGRAVAYGAAVDREAEPRFCVGGLAVAGHHCKKRCL